MNKVLFWFKAILSGLLIIVEFAMLCRLLPGKGSIILLLAGAVILVSSIVEYRRPRAEK